MKFFIDTADIEQIRTANSWGILDGVTTNPTLISKTGRPFKEVVREILEEVSGPVSLETVSMDAEGMIREGRQLAELGENVVVKIPMTPEGMKAVQTLEAEGIPTKAGASYVSPFVGRIDDVSGDGMKLIREIKEIFYNYEIDTEIIVASVRHPMHVVEAALTGADICTMPFPVMERLFRHPPDKPF